MRFGYSYKTSNGTRHEGEIEAANRDAAFALLRERGIRAIRVTAVGGNEGLGRWGLVAVAAVLAALAVAGGGLWWIRPGKGDAPRHEADKVAGRVAAARPRRVLPDLFDGAAADGRRLKELFAHPSEAYLACFAQPGMAVEWNVEGDVSVMLKDDMADAIDDDIRINPGDTRAVADLKRIVAGLKDEVSMLMSSGRGVDEIRGWLEARQKMEIEYRDQILMRVEDGELSEQEADTLLASMGFAPVAQ